MKILFVPSFEWRAGGAMRFDCPDCNRERLHLSLLPQEGEVEWPGTSFGGLILMAVLERSSRSGLTKCEVPEPLRGLGLPYCLGYGKHGWAFPVLGETVKVVPEELGKGLPGIRAKIRGFFKGHPGEFVATAVAVVWPEEVMKFRVPCPDCRASYIVGHSGAVSQGNLTLAPLTEEEEREYFPSCSSWKRQERFFNHWAERGAIYARGQFCSVPSSATIMAEDHDPITLSAREGEGWLGYHPWPTGLEDD